MTLGGRTDAWGQIVQNKFVTVCGTVVTRWVRYKGSDSSEQIRDCVGQGCGLVGQMYGVRLF